MSFHSLFGITTVQVSFNIIRLGVHAYLSRTDVVLLLHLWEGREETEVVGQLAPLLCHFRSTYDEQVFVVW
jgi:hypothetical protein